MGIDLSNFMYWSRRARGLGNGDAATLLDNLGSLFGTSSAMPRPEPTGNDGAAPLQLMKYVSPDLSPVNFSGATDRFLDALFIGQAMTANPVERAKMVRDFERHPLTQAYAAPPDPSLYGAALVVEPDRRHLGKAAWLEHHSQPFHRPGSHRRMARSHRKRQRAV